MRKSICCCNLQLEQIGCLCKGKSSGRPSFGINRYFLQPFLRRKQPLINQQIFTATVFKTSTHCSLPWSFESIPLPQTNCQIHMEVPPSIRLWMWSIQLRILIQNKFFVHWLGHSCLPYHSFISSFTCMNKSTLQQNNKMDQPVSRHGWSGDRLPVRQRDSAPVQTGPGAHPSSYTMGSLGGKVAGV